MDSTSNDAPDGRELSWPERIAAVHDRCGRRAFATLVRVLDDLDRAEEARNAGWRGIPAAA